MPRKHAQQWNHYKPSAPPSHFATPSTPLPHSTESRGVNDLLYRLRFFSAPRSREDPAPIGPSVPPSLQLVLDGAAPPPPHLRVRAEIPPTRRRTPGPPPPASWLLPNPPVVPAASATDEVEFTQFLPDLRAPPPRSLQGFALRSLVRNWAFHEYYDQHHLSSLPTGLKQVLLAHLARYNPAALSRTGMEVLFGNAVDEEVTHLSFPSSIPARELVSFLRPPILPLPEGTAVESWEDAVVTARSRFPGLTHLSLPPSIPPQRVLQVLEMTPGLTHLSLVGFTPKLAVLVKRVSRLTLCLRWLDVSGVTMEVVDAFRDEVAWAGVWRGVETVIVRGVAKEEAEELRKKILGVRREMGMGGWCRVVTEEDCLIAL
jgi:hypothetical protein